MRRLAFMTLLTLFSLFAVTPAFARVDPVHWTATIAPTTVRPGERVTITLKATIQDPYHIYSTIKPTGEGPFPTTVTISGKNLTPDAAISESAPLIKHDPNFKIDIGVHEKEATFTKQALVGADAAAGPLDMKVSVRAMACNATTCLPARPVTIEIPPVTVESGAVRPEFTKAMESGSVAAPVAPGLSSAPGGIRDASTGGADGSIGAFLLAAFGAGLLALITPCVFPLIPVTFAYFTKQAASNGGSVLRLAATYGFAIILMFTALGGVLAATVGAAGANQLAANPWVNLVFGLLFLLFGVALLEIIELRLPGKLQNLSGAGSNIGGVLGVFFMGLTFAIATFTCTAPFIGTVLVAASSATSAGGWVRPILGMMTFSAAIALPFFLLALFPGLLAKLPKSGAWLSTIKGTMGFLELAAALKFLSNADLVWQAKWITTPVMLGVWMALAAAAALYLLGLLRIGYGAPDAPATPARKIWAAVFAAAALYCVYGLTGRPLNEWLVAFLPPTEYVYRAENATNAVAAEDGLKWRDNLEEAQAQAKAENKPLFIDFTGYTCTNCRWMEKNIFPKPEVGAELSKFVLVRLYTDGGKDADKNQQYQEKTFGDVALPLYGILSPDGKPIAKSAGITSEPTKFVAFLSSGQELRTASSAP